MQTGPEFLLSVSSCKGILYLDNIGGVQLKEPPCRTAPATPGLLKTESEGWGGEGRGVYCFQDLNTSNRVTK